MNTNRIILVVMAMMLPLLLNAQKSVLNEGFEAGSIPAGWTQEYGSRTASMGDAVDTLLWQVEQGGTYPSGAIQGQYRALFQGSNENFGAVTRLVTPVLDLYDIFEPVLSFSFAQYPRSGDFDTLRVLYRTSSTEIWRELKTYDSPVSQWTRDQIALPQVSATYYIAFEGKNNLGRGIVLDSVVVQSTPQCTTPSSLVVSEVGAGKATLSWNADYNATSFRIVVDDTRADTVVTEEWTCQLTNLAAGTHVVTVQALCEGEQSDVSAPLSFNMPLDVQLPYSYGFNDCPTSTASWWPEGWKFGNNAGLNAYVSDHSSNDRTSPDNTPALIFSMDYKYWNVLPAGNYQYAATPALIGAPLNQCFVRFSAGVYEYNGAGYAHSIIVGVMTDPEDITTFVPVDTVNVLQYQQFQTCYVDLDSYTGSGQFVAFMSNFDKPNLFYIDNIYIKAHDEKDAPTHVQAIGHADAFDMRWQGRANQYGVELHSEEIQIVLQGQEGDSIVPFDTIICPVSGTSLLVTNMQQWTRYTVRVWADNGDTSEWINTRTSVPYTLPLEYTFNSGKLDTTHLVNDFYAPVGVQTFGTNNFRPHCGSSQSSYTVYGRSGKGFGLSENTSGSLGAHDYWAVYPYMQRLDTMRMTFYLSCGDARNSGKSWLSVGVMEDPQDISTYHELLLCNGTDFWTLYEVDLLDSPLINGFVTMRWVSPDPKQPCLGWVDDVTFTKRSTCSGVTDIRIDSTDIQSTHMSMLYTAPEGASVNVRVSTDRNLSLTQLEHGASCVFTKNNVQGGRVSVTGLSSGNTYYVFMQSVCSDGTTSLWGNPVTITAPCAPLSIPYTNGFEDWSGSTYSITLPQCWYGQGLSIGSRTLAHSGFKYLSISNKQSYLVFPAIDEDLDQVLVSFYARVAGRSSGKLTIGVCTDPQDISTFEQLKVISSSNNEYQRFAYAFTNYQGTGKHLCLMVQSDSTYENAPWYIDDIDIRLLECITPFDIQVGEVSPTSILTTWGGTSENGWHVLVADEKIDPEHWEDAMAHIVVNDTVMEASYKAQHLQEQTLYYLYYRPLCPSAQWADTMAMTQCRSLIMGRLYDFEDQTATTSTYTIPTDAHIECWTMTADTLNALSSATVPYVYKSITLAHSGNNCIRLVAQCGGDHASWFALPAADVDSMNSINIRFYATHDYTYNWMNIKVGVMSDPNDLKTFTQVESVKPETGTHIQFKVSLENYRGSGRYIAFLTTDCSRPVYIDDIEVVESVCRNLYPTVANITAHSVQVNSNVSSQNAWRIRITSEEGFAVDTVVLESPRRAVITGLPEDTYLTLKTASICSISGTDTAYGDWGETQFWTLCEDVMVLNTIEDFESFPVRMLSSDPYPHLPCWQVGNYLSTTALPYVLSMESKDLPRPGYAENQTINAAYSGKNSMVITTGATTDAAWVAMPQISTEEDIRNTQITFWAKGTDAFGSNKLVVGITTDLADQASFEPIDTFILDSRNYNKYMVRFNTYQGDYNGKTGRYITFASQFNDDNMLFIDDVKLSHIPSCIEPTDLRVVSTDDQQAVLTWNGQSDQYRVMVTDTALADTLWESFTGYLSNDTIYSDTLIVHMPYLDRYYLYVKAICGEEGSWNISGVDFAPTCDALLDIPAMEGFEDNDLLPVCWQPVESGFYNQVSVDTAQVHTGIRSLRIHDYYYSSTKTATGIILPRLSEEPGDCKLTLFANKDKQSTNTIYAALLPARDSILVDSLAQIPSVMSKVVIGNTWNELTFDFSSLKGQQVAGMRYIALYTTTSNRDNDLFIDDVRLEKMNTCRAPESISATMLGGGKANVTLVPYRVYNTDWEILLTDTNTQMSQTVSTDQLTTVVEGLNSNTVYALTARTTCGLGEYSAWGDTIYLRTSVTPTGLEAAATDSTLLIHWDRQEHGHWNLYISREQILPGQVETLPIEAFDLRLMNTTDTSYIFPAQENTTYYILLQSANMGSDEANFASQTVTTMRHVYEPENLVVTSLCDSAVTLAWTNPVPKDNILHISTQSDYSDTVTAIRLTDTLSYTYSQLQPQTTYYVRICQVASVYQSAWVETHFTTLCLPQDLPLEYGFEDSTLPACWTTLSNRAGYPCANTEYYTEGLQSWEWHAASDGQLPQAIVLPRMSADLSDYAIHFQARCQDASGSQAGEAEVMVALTNDIYHLSTATLSEQYQVGSTIVSGNAFQHYTIDMSHVDSATASANQYIILYLNSQGHLYMDELEVTESERCHQPTSLAVTELTGYSATLTFSQNKPSGTWVYTLCSNRAMTDTIRTDTVHEQTFTINGLTKQTTYYISLYEVCGEYNRSEASSVVEFTTIYAPYYEELFRVDTITALTDWTRATAMVDDIFKGGSLTPDRSKWQITKSDVGISGHHALYFAYTSIGYHNDWLISPTISLSSDDSTLLSFDMALTMHTNDQPAQFTDGLRLLALVSADGGQTWLSENAMRITDVPATAKRYAMDLTRFRGQMIKVAFYVEVTDEIANLDVHLSNVRINWYSTEHFETTICQYDPIEFDDKVFVDAPDYPAGDYNEYVLLPAEDPQGGLIKDLVRQYTAHILPSPTVEIYDTICEGTVYTAYGFENLTKSGTYKQKHTAANDCDSTVVLYLQVNAIGRASLRDTIQKGESYHLLDKVYTMTGIYSDTTMAANGCDSVITLALFVKSDVAQEFDARTCEGTPYEWDGVDYYEAGNYTQRYETYEGGDSIVTMHLKVDPLKWDTIYDYIQEGFVYVKYNFVEVEPGEHRHTDPSAITGCDSTTVLYLLPSTGLINIPLDGQNTMKVVDNNRVIILHNGGYYSILGQKEQ